MILDFPDHGDALRFERSYLVIDLVPVPEGFLRVLHLKVFRHAGFLVRRGRRSAAASQGGFVGSDSGQRN
jgi:hypothetical protein